MWTEFNQHFSNPDREQGNKLNHHDFLDSQFIKNKDSGRRGFFQKVGTNSMSGFHTASQDRQNYYTNTRVDLGYNKFQQQQRNFEKMSSKAYELNMNTYKIGGVPKYLQEKIKSQGRAAIRPRVYLPQTKPLLESVKKHQLSQQRLPKKTKSSLRKDTIPKDFDRRNLFVLVDG